MQKNNINLPITYTKLSNGLRAVVAQDHSSPVATVAVFYQVGFRSEIKGRTGFAHLFEHLMFQGTKNITKNKFIKLIEETGGIVNGTTQPDFTNYFETLPAQAVDMALWIEFERMLNPKITQSELNNQRDVVKNEIKVNVLNRPYGGFPWIDMSEKAFTNWQNNHNGYGDMDDLSAASIIDVKSFYTDYYNPSNATIVVTGDVDPNHVIKKIEELFSQIPQSELIPSPDLTEPEQKKENRHHRIDRLAPKPAMCIAYHAPPRMSNDFFALGLFDQMFVQGEDSLLNKSLVREKGITEDIFGGITFEGNMFTSKDPMLWHFSMIYDELNSSEHIIKLVDQLLNTTKDKKNIAQLLPVARTKIDSSLFHVLQRGPYKGIGLAEMLAAFSFYDDNPFLINEIQDRFYDIDSEQILNVIDNYLNKANRNILFVKPGA